MKDFITWFELSHYSDVPGGKYLIKSENNNLKFLFHSNILMVFYRSGVIIKNFPKSSFQIWWHLEFTVDKFILWASSWHLVLLNVKSCSVTFQGLRHGSTFIITHTPLFQGGAAYVVMNIHNPSMHCVMSQYVFKPGDVIMLNNPFSVATIMCNTESPCCILFDGRFHQDSATQWNKLQI